MREPSKSIWYRLGYALELARHGARSAQESRSGEETPSAKEAPRAAKSGSATRAQSAQKARGKATDARSRPVSSNMDHLIATGTGILVDRLFSIVAGRRPGTLRLTHAALAGAGAALALSLFRNGKNGTPEGRRSLHDPTTELLAGAARGVLYGAVLEPRLPGSPLTTRLPDRRTYGSPHLARGVCRRAGRRLWWSRSRDRCRTAIGRPDEVH